MASFYGFMCGIVGITSHHGVAPEIYEGLIGLQHRGQESAGMATFGERFSVKKGMGLVRDVFTQESINELQGNFGIGMVRYSTVGSSLLEEAQPFLVNSPYGIAIVYNGNVYNSWELREELFTYDLRYLNSQNDAEVILNVFASSLASVTSRVTSRDFFDALCHAVKSVFQRVYGGYSVLMLIAGKGLLVFRDPHGIRPLVWGERQNGLGSENIFASENTMFEVLGYQFARDVEPGEVVFVSLDGQTASRIVLQKEFRPCIFEYVYFARSDALLNGVSVHRARLRMGQNLGRKIKKVYPHLPIDIVIPAPTTANTAALSCAHVLGARYSEAIIKNQFIGRTFIMPGEETRRRANKYKLSVIEFEVKGKNVLIVDDSIVRGNVSRHLVKILREHGARRVYFASASPPLRHPDLYGIDLPTREELIAYNKSEDEVRESIGADLLIYQDLEDLIEAVMRRGVLKFKRPHVAYFNGDYPTEDVTEEVLRQIERRRKGEREKIVPSSYHASSLPLFSTQRKKILVIGSGAREHCIVHTLKRTSQQDFDIVVFGSSRNPGISPLVLDFQVGDVSDFHAVLEFAKKHKVTFAIVGPEAPLEAGVINELLSARISAVGPTRALASIETSKSFTRQLLQEYEITASPRWRVFDSMEGVTHWVNELQSGFVIKPDGLTGGKGVQVQGDHFQTVEEGIHIIEGLIRNGERVVLEEKLVGQEFSLMSFSDGKHLVHMPPVQDHKRAYEGDKGPNTGGMGSYSCADHLLPFLEKRDLEDAMSINERVAATLRKKCGVGYKGILYGGFVAVKDGVRLIEYNARFGDPEVMNVLSLLQADFVYLCEAITHGTLHQMKVEFAPFATVVKYAVPEGYPLHPLKDREIEVSFGDFPDVAFYFGAVDERDQKFYLTGSRAVAVVGVHKDLAVAESIAENGASSIRGPVFHRKDIGTAELLKVRVDMLRKVRNG